MIRRVFKGPTINNISVGFDMELFDRGLVVACAYGEPHIACSVKSKDLLIQESIKDCNKCNRRYNREEMETSYKGMLIEINEELLYGEYLAIVPSGDIIVKYNILT